MAIHNGPHKYVRIKIGKFKRPWFKCAIAGCSHSIRPELAVGRMSICNRCDEEMILTKLNMQLAKPHCDDCTKRKDTSKDKMRELIERMEL